MKVNDNVFKFSKKILKLFNEKKVDLIEKPKIEKPYIKEENRIIGSTDYKKYEDMSKKIDNEELESKIVKTNEALKMGCNNDRRKERQLFDKPSKDKLDASKIFKGEGDEHLKSKNWETAIDSYDKALLQLFYIFSDDIEEENQSDKLKIAINLNISMCKINMSLFDEAVGYCQEVLRMDKNNMKAIYRLAFCYFKKDNFEESYNYINMGNEIEKDNLLLLELKNDILKRKNFLDYESSKLYKKIIK